MKVLILSGGGARGAFQAGVYQQFIEEGWEPDAVAGVSVGALNGAMIATGKGKKLKKLWWDISEDQVLKKNNMLRVAKNFVLRKVGIPMFVDEKVTLGYYSNAPLHNLLKKNIGNQFTSDFYCGTVNIDDLTYKAHRMRKMMVPWNFLDEILASTAIPLVFNPVKVGQYLHVDGGVRHMSPLRQVLSETDPTEIRILLCNKYRGYRSLRKGPVKDPIDLAKRTVETVLNEIFMKDLREFERINRFVRQAADKKVVLRKSNGKPYTNYEAKIYEPTKSLGDSLNFGADQARENFNHGYNTLPIII